MQSIVPDGDANYTTVLHAVKDMVIELKSMEEEKQMLSRQRGRPSFSITEQALTELLQLHFTLTEIAVSMDVHVELCGDELFNLVWKS